MEDKIAIYTRVSKFSQSDGDSLPLQRQDLINYAIRLLNCNNYVIFEDAGFSGGNDDRPQYQDMLKRMRQGEFTYLLVWKFDRLSRNINDFCKLYEELKALNITFISKMEQFDTSTAIGQALLKIIYVFAEMERKYASERVKSTMLAKAAAGEYTGFRIPFGYRRIDGQYVIDSKEARIIHKIFDMFEADDNVYAIMTYLNGLPVKERCRLNWTTSSIERMITNVFYTGTLRYNYYNRTFNNNDIINPHSEWILVENHHPSIITIEQFQKCLDLYKQHKEQNRQTRKPLFANLIYCDCHSNPFRWRKEDSKVYNSPAKYRCNLTNCSNHEWISDNELCIFIMNYLLNLLRTYRRWNPDLPILTFKKSLLRGDSFKEIKGIDKNDVNIFLALVKNSQIPDAELFEQEFQSIKYDILVESRGLEKLDLLYNYKDSDMTEAAYLDVRHKMENRIKELKKKLELITTQNPNKIPEDIDFLFECYNFFLENKLYNLDKIVLDNLKEIPFYKFKHFLQRVIAQITVNNGNIVAIHFVNSENHVHHFVYR